MPTGVEMSCANVNDSTVGQSWPIVEDTVYVFDKGYYDFNWWWKIDQNKAFFVTRLKYNVALEVIRSFPVADEKILEDGLFEFKNKNPRGGKKNLYTKPLRRVVVKREGKETPLILVTNLLDVPAETIGELYKERWGIELFFKWIKQNLRIKKFLGRTENAVKIQIVIALIAYLLLGILKYSVKSELSFHQFLIWVRHNCDTKRNIYPSHFDLRS
jgi:putative transposase